MNAFVGHGWCCDVASVYRDGMCGTCGRFLRVERGIHINQFYVLLTYINLLRLIGVAIFKSNQIKELVKITKVLVLLLSSDSSAFELPSRSSFYVMNSSCCGGEESILMPSTELKRKKVILFSRAK